MHRMGKRGGRCPGLACGDGADEVAIDGGGVLAEGLADPVELDHVEDYLEMQCKGCNR
jgi:hypothetical protein